MASIGEIYATQPPVVDSEQTEGSELEFYFGVFFDGTSNNMVQKDAAKAFRNSVVKRPDASELGYKWEFAVKYNSDMTDGTPIENVVNPTTGGGNKPGESLDSIKYSNVAILHSQYTAMSKKQYEEKKARKKEIRIFNIYIEGPGTEEIWSSNILEKAITAPGSISGRGHTGIVNLVSKALKMVSIIVSGYNIERIKNAKIHFDVFGFSRGAACARLFAHLVARSQNAPTLPCEEKFGNSYASSLLKDNRISFLSDFKERKVDFLGIFDTVCATGGLSVDSYLDNTEEFGLYSPKDENVLNVLHIIAIDEFRSHFGVTDIGSASSSKKTELYIPGCHSDIGGGYIDGIDEFNLCLYNTPIAAYHIPGTYNMPSISSKRISIFSDKYLGGKINENTQDLNCASLKALGWLCEEQENITFAYNWRLKKLANKDGKNRYLDWVRETNYDIEVKRFVLGGYCNIPLKIMKDRAENNRINEIENRNMFVNPGNLPPEYNPKFICEIDSELKGVVDELIALSDRSGKYYYLPGGTFNSDKYKRLRKFLHFTSKESVGFTPSYNSNSICRYVYSGNPDGKKRFFMNEVMF